MFKERKLKEKIKLTDEITFDKDVSVNSTNKGDWESFNTLANTENRFVGETFNDGKILRARYKTKTESEIIELIKSKLKEKESEFKKISFEISVLKDLLDQIS